MFFFLFMDLKRALITSISGSRGSNLAECIVNNHQEAEICGVSRWHNITSYKNLESIADRIQVHECNLNDFGSILKFLKKTKLYFSSCFTHKC